MKELTFTEGFSLPIVRLLSDDQFLYFYSTHVGR